MKECKHCKIDQPLEAFPKSPFTKDGRISKCKSCTSEYHKARNAKKQPPLIAYILDEPILFD